MAFTPAPSGPTMQEIDGPRRSTLSGALMGLFLFADLRRRDAWLSLRHWA